MALYHIEIKDKTTKLKVILFIKDSNTINIGLYHSEIEKYPQSKVYSLDFSDSNPGTAEDILKAAEYLRDEFKYLEKKTDIADVDIEAEIHTSSIEFEEKKGDAIWDLMMAILGICHGETMIRDGSQKLQGAYDTLEKYININ